MEALGDDEDMQQLMLQLSSKYRRGSTTIVSSGDFEEWIVQISAVRKKESLARAAGREATLVVEENLVDQEGELASLTQEELEAMYNMNMISGPEVRARVGFWGGGRGCGSAAIINTASVFTVELLPLRALRSPSNRILNISPPPPPSSTCI